MGSDPASDTFFSDGDLKLTADLFPITAGRFEKEVLFSFVG
jgi:hypothetical protein